MQDQICLSFCPAQKPTLLWKAYKCNSSYVSISILMTYSIFHFNQSLLYQYILYHQINDVVKCAKSLRAYDKFQVSIWYQVKLNFPVILQSFLKSNFIFFKASSRACYWWHR